MFWEKGEENLENLINGVKLTLDYSFGMLQTPIENQAVFVSDDNIVFPSGKHLVMYDLQTKKSDFINRPEPNILQVTSLSTGFTKKKELMIIYGEKLKNAPPRATIYYPARMKWSYFPHSHLTSEYEITYLEVNWRYLITLSWSKSGPP